MTGCPCSAGVARSVMLARLATKAAKPDGCFVLDSRAPSAQVCIMLWIMTTFAPHFHNIDLGMRHLFWCLSLIATSLIFNTNGLFIYVTCISFSDSSFFGSSINRRFTWPWARIAAFGRATMAWDDHVRTAQTDLETRVCTQCSPR